MIFFFFCNTNNLVKFMDSERRKLLIQVCIHMADAYYWTRLALFKCDKLESKIMECKAWKIFQLSQILGQFLNIWNLFDLGCHTPPPTPPCPPPQCPSAHRCTCSLQCPPSSHGRIPAASWVLEGLRWQCAFQGPTPQSKDPCCSQSPCRLHLL